MANCLQCKKYIQCKDKAKSISYVCSMFSKDKSEQFAKFLEQTTVMPFNIGNRDFDSSMPVVVEGAHHSDFNAYEMVENIINDKRIVSPDIKFPESDFPAAKNFLEWCISDRFLYQTPFIAQAVIATVVFTEWCPECSDNDYLDNFKVNDSLTKFQKKICLLEHGVCPHCKKTKLQLFAKRLLKPYSELALAAGQRSGKSALLGMMSSYLTHRMLKLERPYEVYGLLKATVLQGTFVALTYAQAKDTLWDPYYGNLLDSPWFQQYHAALDEVQSRTGEEMYRLKDTFVYYRHRRIHVYPAGPDKRVLRGRTRFLASVDELGWFPNDKSADKNIKMNANEVYIALERSLLTVRASAKRAIKRGFYNVPFGYFLNISSPSSVRDKIMELVRASQHSPKIYGLAKPTWEMNPTVTYEDLAEEFKKDYNAAMRDYGAQPPLTNNPFIGNEDYLVKCFNKPNRLKLAVKYKKFPNGTQEVYSSLLDVPGGSKPSVLTLDAGHANNSFAFAIGHKNNAGMTVISVVGEVMAQSDAKISFSLVYKHLLSELTLLKNIVLVGADRWNSLKILSDMGEEFGIETKVYSLKYTDFNNFKSDLENRKIGLPKPKKSVTDILKYDQSKYPYCFRDTPEEHLVVQMLTVQDTGSGVIKGEQLTDDIFRATVLADALLNNQDFAHLFIGGSDEVEEQVATVNISQMMVSKNYSGGGAHSGSNASTNMVGVRATRKN